MKQNSSLRKVFALGAALGIAAVFSGCAESTSQPVQSATPQPVGQSQAAPAGEQQRAAVANDPSLVRVQRVYGEGATVGQPYEFQIVVTALKPTADVTIRQELPRSVEFRSSFPAAELDEAGTPSWNLGALPQGEQRTISLVVIPAELGNFSFNTTVRAQPVPVEVVRVGQAQLDVELQGAESVDLGEKVVWKVLVTNNGSVAARNVRIGAILPEGFQVTGAQAQRLTRLLPGQSSQMVIEATPTEAGVYSANFSVSHEGADVSHREAQILVRGSQVRIVASAPASRYIFSPATYSLVVTNTGGTPLEGLVLLNELPEGAVLLGQVRDAGEVYSLASGEPQKLALRTDAATGVAGYWLEGGEPLHDTTADQIQWQLERLAPGQSVTREVTYYSITPGQPENRVRVVGPRGVSSGTAFATDWRAIPGIFTALVDSADPIRIGDEVTYTATVGNQAKEGAITVSSLQVVIPDVLKVESASEGGRIEGNTVTFSRIALEAQQQQQLTITATGQKLGTGIAVMTTTTNFHAESMVNEQSISVY